MVTDYAKSVDEIGDDPNNFEGLDESEVSNEDNSDYDEGNSLNENDESTLFAEEFERGTQRDDDARDDKGPDADREEEIGY